jgi:CRISPR-associated endonuclease Csy4
MDHYLDLRLRADPEFPQHQLMDALFARLHRALVPLDSTGIGLSFPDARGLRGGLGARMRLHGTEAALEPIASLSWLVGMRDHVDASDLNDAPRNARLIAVRRVQAKSNAERVRRRQMKRKGWTADEAMAAIPDTAAQSLDLPFLTVRSISTGQTFRLFVRQQVAPLPAEGRFNAYGFSTEATLPYF